MGEGVANEMVDTPQSAARRNHDPHKEAVNFAAEIRRASQRRRRIVRSVGALLVTSTVVVLAVLWQRDHRRRVTLLDPLETWAARVNEQGISETALAGRLSELRLPEGFVLLILPDPPHDPTPVAVSSIRRDLLFGPTGRAVAVFAGGRCEARWMSERDFRTFCDQTDALMPPPAPWE